MEGWQAFQLVWQLKLKRGREGVVAGCRIWKPPYHFLPAGPRVKCFGEHTLEGNSKHQCDFGESMTMKITYLREFSTSAEVSPCFLYIANNPFKACSLVLGTIAADDSCHACFFLLHVRLFFPCANNWHFSWKYDSLKSRNTTVV